MADEDFPTEVEILFDAGWILRIELTLARHLVEALHFLPENLREGILLDAATPLHILLTHGHIELHAADPGAVLAAIVLLFH